MDINADRIEPSGFHLLKDIWPQRWHLDIQEDTNLGLRLLTIIYKKHLQEVAMDGIRPTYTRTILSSFVRVRSVAVNIPDKETLTTNNQAILIPLDHISESVGRKPSSTKYIRSTSSKSLRQQSSYSWHCKMRKLHSVGCSLLVNTKTCWLRIVLGLYVVQQPGAGCGPKGSKKTAGPGQLLVFPIWQFCELLVSPTARSTQKSRANLMKRRHIR